MSLNAGPDRRLSLFSFLSFFFFFLVATRMPPRVSVRLCIRQGAACAINRAEMICREKVDARSTKR